MQGKERYTERTEKRMINGRLLKNRGEQLRKVRTGGENRIDEEHS